MERYAIDFGTSNTVVSRWNYAKEQPETLSFPKISTLPEGPMPPVVPSVLYNRGDNEFLCGYEVTSRGLDDIHSNRYFWGFKRGLLHMTSLFADREHEYSDDNIARRFLDRILSEIDINKETTVTFTAPVNAFDTYREWISSYFT